LLYATFLGGGMSSEHTEGSASRFDVNGDLYLAVCAGCGSNDDFPTTPGALSPTNGSAINCNLAAVKFSLDGTTDVPESASSSGSFVWPSPSNDLVNISCCDDPPCKLVVTDATGRVVARTKIIGASMLLSVQHLAPGAYQVLLGEGSHRKHGRFIVR
jgi:hypothetical protein